MARDSILAKAQTKELFPLGSMAGRKLLIFSCSRAGPSVSKEDTGAVERSTKPLALDAYEFLADSYAAHVDTKPHNAWYERPATLSLLPDVAGLTALDAGCGPGVYSEWLLRHGARVTAVDASPRMIELARARVGPEVQFHCADLAAELSFITGGYFDIVLAPLVLDYLHDWPAVFHRFHRALKPAGLFVFSVGHPAFNAEYFQTRRYFEIEAVSCVWKGFGPRVQMPSYRRSLAEIFNPLLDSGFDLLRVLEPLPTEEFRQADPLSYERLLHRPSFLCLKAQKRAV